MTTVIHNPGNNNDSNNPTGLIVGIIALIIVIALFFVYILPIIRNSQALKDSGIDVNLTLPNETKRPITN